MRFKNIIGQKFIIDSLIKSIENNLAAHAYIFEGSKGIGKKTTAKEFAGILVCESEKKLYCKTCRSCLLSNVDNHPDIKIISGDSSIGVDLIRQMIKDINIKPYYGQKIVYIIEDADKMTSQAQNSLLKTLEEPPEYGVIILTTTDLNPILPTILSRCIVKKFIRNSNSEIEEFIKINYSNTTNSNVIISLADGSIGNAVELIASEDFNNLRQKGFDIIDKVLNSNVFDTLSLIRTFNDHKENIDLLLNIILLYFRDMLIIKEADNKFVINVDFLNKLINISAKVSPEKMQDCILSVLDAKNKLTLNSNFTITIEVMLLKFKQYQEDKT